MSDYVLPTESVIAWRRHIHQHPELSFHETKTADYIAGVLEGIDGLKVERPTPTIIIATLDGLAGEGKTLAFRADTDALPVLEENDLPFKSQNPGVMHACGHDMHSAMLMGTALVLSEMRDRLTGRVKFIFQPAEEMPPGGAIEVIKVGALEGVDHCFGLHVLPGKLGKLRIFTDRMASTSCGSCNIKIQGQGSHGSTPHLSIDPILVGAQIIEALHTIVSRNISPEHFAVVSPNVFRGGNAVNVIPDTAEIGVNIRTKDKADRKLILGRVEQLAKGIGENNNAQVVVEWLPGYDAIEQDLDLVKEVTDLAIRELGEENVIFSGAFTASEDFSEYSKVVDSCMYMALSCGDATEGCGFMNHHPKFNPQEGCLDVGVQMEVAIARHFLERK